MEKQIQIFVSNTNQLKERVISFFGNYGFKLLHEKNDILKFTQKSTLLDAWKQNPLKWGSEIVVNIERKTVFANFLVETDAQMNTIEEENVWLTFIENFENYLINGKINNEKLNLTISTNIKNRINYFGWAFLGAIAGGLLAFLYNKLNAHNSSLSMFLIPTVATLFLSARINFIKSKKAI